MWADLSMARGETNYKYSTQWSAVSSDKIPEDLLEGQPSEGIFTVNCMTLNAMFGFFTQTNQNANFARSEVQLPG